MVQSLSMFLFQLQESISLKRPLSNKKRVRDRDGDQQRNDEQSDHQPRQ